ncbi:MAG: hypothetical protein HYT73_04170 [Candidatus Aenigmarchaeota archaeon]|nr:hypothetical protein [Candidatus Aenigmarchaeota archaeon]
MRLQLMEDIDNENPMLSPTRTQMEYLGRIGRFQLLEDVYSGMRGHVTDNSGERDYPR